jgi:hypothetical protein
MERQEMEIIYYIIFLAASAVLYLGHYADARSTVLEKNRIWRNKDGGIDTKKYMAAAAGINLIGLAIGYFGEREGHAWLWLVASAVLAARGVWAFRTASRNRKLKRGNG